MKVRVFFYRLFLLFTSVECFLVYSLSSTKCHLYCRPMLAAAFRHTCRVARRPANIPTVFTTEFALNVYNTRESDPIERIIGGTRYEFVPIPESMKSTTIYVGNICEFAHDDDLSALFQKVSKLQSVPACIARKVDTSSLQYGFVSFPSVEEKEQAIIRFNNFEWRGKHLKVEEVKDSPKTGERVNVPGKLVAYVTGLKENEVKKKQISNSNKLQRISRDDVERLSRGQASKQRGYGSRKVPHRLNDPERSEWDRAARKGYLSLVGGGNRRTRKGSPLVNIHRQWCDARAKPQILLYKATSGRTVDQVVIDASPLRLQGMFDDPTNVEEFMVKWRAQAMAAAVQCELEISEDTTNTYDLVLNEIDVSCDYDDNDNNASYSITLENIQEAWATKPIWKLPEVHIGIFEGERSKAKRMAKTLAELWEIPEECKVPDVDGCNKSDSASQEKRKRKTFQAQERKRGGGHRQEWF